MFSLQRLRLGKTGQAKKVVEGGVSPRVSETCFGLSKTGLFEQGWFNRANLAEPKHSYLNKA